jgi:hypothetical protein
MLVSLLGYFTLMVTTLTAVVAVLINFSNNNSVFEKGHLPGPIIVQTVSADETPPPHSPVAKDASPAKNDVFPVKQPKPRVLARQGNSHGYGNTYAYRNDPRSFFIH